MNDINILCPEMTSLRDAAKRTGLSYNALRVMCLNGEVAHIRIGRDIKINFTHLCELLNNSGIK